MSALLIAQPARVNDHVIIIKHVNTSHILLPVQGLPLPIDSFHIEMSEYLQSPSAAPEKLAEISHVYKHMHNNRSKATVAGHLSKKSSHVTLLLNIYTNIHSISL